MSVMDRLDTLYSLFDPWEGWAPGSQAVNPGFCTRYHDAGASWLWVVPKGVSGSWFGVTVKYESGITQFEDDLDYDDALALCKHLADRNSGGIRTWKENHEQ